MKKEGRSQLAILILILAIAGTSAGENRFSFKYNSLDRKLLRQCQEAEEKWEREGKVYHDAEMERHLNDMGRRMIPADFTAEGVEFSFKIFRSPIVNAFALPNGSIYANLGLIARMETEDQLASVLAHEITHVVNGHAFLSSRGDVVAAVPRGIAIALGFGLVADMIYVIAANGYSRDMEKEADLNGLEYCTRAGYNPRQAPTSLERLLVDPEHEYKPGMDNIFYSDHPKINDRIEYLTKEIEESYSRSSAGYEFEQARKLYLDCSCAMRLESAELDMKMRRFRSAKLVIDEILEFRPDDPFATATLGLNYLEWSKQRRKETAREKEQEEEKTSNATRAAQRVDDQEEPEEQPEPDELLNKAFELGKKAQKLDPSLPLPYKVIGLSFYQKGILDQAEKALKIYLEVSQDKRDKLIIKKRLEQIQKQLSQKQDQEPKQGQEDNNEEQGEEQ